MEPGKGSKLFLSRAWEAAWVVVPEQLRALESPEISKIVKVKLIYTGLIDKKMCTRRGGIQARVDCTAGGLYTSSSVALKSSMSSAGGACLELKDVLDGLD